jgi:hypothetical protein
MLHTFQESAFPPISLWENCFEPKKNFIFHSIFPKLQYVLKRFSMCLLFNLHLKKHPRKHFFFIPQMYFFIMIHIGHGMKSGSIFIE